MNHIVKTSLNTLLAPGTGLLMDINVEWAVDTLHEHFNSIYTRNHIL